MKNGSLKRLQTDYIDLISTYTGQKEISNYVWKIRHMNIKSIDGNWNKFEDVLGTPSNKFVDEGKIRDSWFIKRNCLGGVI